MIILQKKNFLIRLFLSFMLVFSGFYFEQCSKKEKIDPNEFPKVPNPVDCTDVDTREMFKEVGIDLDKLAVFSLDVLWTHSAWVVWNKNQLEQLYYDGRLRPTKIFRLPEKIGCEKKLILLRLPNNSLTELPDSIGELYELEELDLSYSLLGTLPQNFSYLRSLKKLVLLGNRLNYFPSEILALKKLETLFLCALEVDQEIQIPYSITELPVLRSLCLPKVSEEKQKEILTWFKDRKDIIIQFL